MERVCVELKKTLMSANPDFCGLYGSTSLFKDILPQLHESFTARYAKRILLTCKDILEKEFKIDTKGYRPQEVDKFLDAIIRDYEEFFKIIKEIETDKKELIEDNIKLKQEIRNLHTKLDVLKESASTEVTNADILRRLSKLEKFIYDEK